MNDPTPNIPTARRDWRLDNLGNWTGDATWPGLAMLDDINGDGQNEHSIGIKHGVNTDNQITSLTTVTDGGPPVQTANIHDKAGNLVFAAGLSGGPGSLGIAPVSLFYQYDGFNRLVQVNLAADGTTTWLTAGNFDSDGRLAASGTPPTLPTPGPVLAKFVYDGLGRLIRTTRHDRAAIQNTQVEDYYYDGVRRIQEVDVTTLPNNSSTTKVRDYVWGPDYVDEVLCQVEWNSTTGQSSRWYYLQDANFNVVGVYGSACGMMEQYAWEPYGQLAAKDVTSQSCAKPSVTRIGHQGLFFERFYWQPGDDLTAAGNDTLVPSASGRSIVGLYHNRNRWYSPDLGRFVQRDPNETGIPIVAAMAMNGKATSILLGGFDGQGLYGDGMNLYLYLQGNPPNRFDSAGLFSLVELCYTISLDLYLNACVLGSAPIGAAIVKGVVVAAFAYQAYFLATDDDYREQCIRDLPAYAMSAPTETLWSMSSLLREARILRRFSGAVAVGEDLATTSIFRGGIKQINSINIVIADGASMDGVAYLAPNGKVYVGRFHFRIQEYLKANGLWKTLDDPGGPGWAYGFINKNGDFQGSPIPER